MLETIPVLLESSEFLEKIVVAGFSVFAAILTLWADRIRKRKKEEKIIETHGTDKYIELAFAELQKTTDLLREENRHLLEYNRSLGHKIDDYRNRYQEQIELSTEQIIENLSNEEHIRELNHKIEELMDQINNLICNKDQI